MRSLRGLVSLDVGGNPLRQLDLSSNGSLVRFGGRDCGFVTLDVAPCARVMELVDVRGCADLAVLYIASGQQIFVALLRRGGTQVVER